MELWADAPRDIVQTKKEVNCFREKPPTLWPFKTMFILSQLALIIINPCHLSAGLIYPVNSMQMFHETAVNGNSMYLIPC